MQLLSGAINQKFFPSLNGLRGVSIIMVVMAHLHLSNNHLYDFFFNGSLGVNIFFVLSGFLITTLCIKEQNITGGLSLKGFYIRRILRIFPVAYLYLAVLFILNLVYNLDINNIQFVGSLFYLMNFSYFKVTQFSWFTAHYWSLSAEEQFYIIFPFLLKKSFKGFFYSIIFIVVALPILCTLQEIYKPLNHGIFHVFTSYFIKFQSIAVGCLFSILSFKKALDYNWLRPTKIAGNIVAFFLIVYLKYDPIYWTIKVVYVNLVISLLTGYIVVSNIVPSEDFIYKFLNNKLLSTIGVLSYSIYIWQQIFTSQNLHLPKFMVFFPSNLIFIIGVPIVSYFFFEKYFLKLKSKFSKLKENSKVADLENAV